MAKKVKVGIIGLGWPGLEHLKGYKQCADAEVVALCDMNSELAAQQAAEHGIAQVYSDHKQMLEEADIDAISVCLPNFLHAPFSLDALRAGKHVICEKPPALNAKEARKMAELASKKNAGGGSLSRALADEPTTLEKAISDSIGRRTAGSRWSSS